MAWDEFGRFIPEQTDGWKEQRPPFKTNKAIVTSLDEALARPAERCSEMIYFHQDNKIAFEIRTDERGYKKYRVIDLKLHEVSEPNSAVLDINAKVDKLSRDIEFLKQEIANSREVKHEPTSTNASTSTTGNDN